MRFRRIRDPESAARAPITGMQSHDAALGRPLFDAARPAEHLMAKPNIKDWMDARMEASGESLFDGPVQRPVQKPKDIGHLGPHL